MTLAALPADYEMQPCPFCKGARVRLHSWQQRGAQHRVQCLTPGCEAQGPRRFDADEAMQAWNERA